MFRLKLFLKSAFLILFAGCLFVFSAYATGNSPTGFWKTMDTDTNKPASVIQIVEKNGELQGKIVKLYNDSNAVCAKCKGNLHNKPLLGLTVISGFTAQNSEWRNGKVLVAQRGREFDANLKLLNESQLQLTVKTPIGTREQIWQRVANADAP